MDLLSEISVLRKKIERACCAHDDAGRLGEDQFPHKVRISGLRFDLSRREGELKEAMRATLRQSDI